MTVIKINAAMVVEEYRTNKKKVLDELLGEFMPELSTPKQNLFHHIVGTQLSLLDSWIRIGGKTVDQLMRYMENISKYTAVMRADTEFMEKQLAIPIHEDVCATKIGDYIDRAYIRLQEKHGAE